MSVRGFSSLFIAAALVVDMGLLVDVVLVEFLGVGGAIIVMPPFSKLIILACCGLFVAPGDLGDGGAFRKTLLLLL